MTIIEKMIEEAVLDDLESRKHEIARRVRKLRIQLEFSESLTRDLELTDNEALYLGLRHEGAKIAILGAERILDLIGHHVHERIIEMAPNVETAGSPNNINEEHDDR